MQGPIPTILVVKMASISGGLHGQSVELSRLRNLTSAISCVRSSMVERSGMKSGEAVGSNPAEHSKWIVRRRGTLD